MPWAAGHSREQTAGFLARCERDWATGDAYEYAITADGLTVGSCGLIRRIRHGGLKIGYWLSPTRTGRGLATSAAAALTIQAFALPGMERVEIHHAKANIASEAVPGRLGFTRVESRPASPTFAPAGSKANVIWRMEREALRSREWKRRLSPQEAPGVGH
ncbi:GNAT family N-acetyltransferase [Streptomyces flavidovirens]|uniref:GNAT family N-acetyltransferase n=1 Tax=Streptomyces flavidovirens TaxID=67298 RepID=A0ABW6R8L9_9ACTN